MPTLYINVSTDTALWLDQLSTGSGLPKGKITDLILSRARAEGWSVTSGSAPAVVAGPASPGAGPGTTRQEENHSE